MDIIDALFGRTEATIFVPESKVFHKQPGLYIFLQFSLVTSHLILCKPSSFAFWQCLLPKGYVARSVR